MRNSTKIQPTLVGLRNGIRANTTVIKPYCKSLVIIALFGCIPTLRLFDGKLNMVSRLNDETRHSQRIQEDINGGTEGKYC